MNGGATSVGQALVRHGPETRKQTYCIKFAFERIDVQVVVAVGPARIADGVSAFMNQMLTSERVDAQGVANIADQAAAHLPKASLVVDPVMQSSDFNSWQAKDDAVMGGRSSSTVSCDEQSNGASFDLLCL
jgi:hypothetical protein